MSPLSQGTLRTVVWFKGARIFVLETPLQTSHSSNEESKAVSVEMPMTAVLYLFIYTEGMHATALIQE